MADDGAALRWSGYEHEHVERTSDWFWALGIIAVCVSLISILLNNVLFGVLVLIASFTIAMLAKNPPDLMEFELSELGIRVGGVLHRYEEVISFWVEEEGKNAPMLLVDTIKFMSPNLIIPLEEIDPRAVRSYLQKYVDEVPMKESASHKILEFLGL